MPADMVSGRFSNLPVNGTFQFRGLAWLTVALCFARNWRLENRQHRQARKPALHLPSGRFSNLPVNLETAVGMNREPRGPREPKEPKWNLAGPKRFTQWVKGGLFKDLCSFAYFAYFAVSTAEVRVNGTFQFRGLAWFALTVCRARNWRLENRQHRQARKPALHRRSVPTFTSF